MRGALVLVVLLAAAGPASAAQPFTADLPFTDLQVARTLPTLSGALDVSADAGGAPAVLSNVSAFTIRGLTVVCWQSPCVKGDGLSLRVDGGSTVALRYPQTGVLRLQAEHAIAVPLDIDSTLGGFGALDAGLTIAPSLAAATTAGTLRFEREELAATPDGAVPAPAPSFGGVPLPPAVAGQFQAPDPTDANAALLASLTPSSRIEVLDATGAVTHVLRGRAGVLMQGVIEVSPVTGRAFVVPCAVACEVEVQASRPRTDVAGAIGSLLDLVAQLEGRPLPSFGFGPFAALVDPLAAGAFVELPLQPKDFAVANLTLARFDTLRTTLSPASTQASGSGALVILSGDVSGAPAFVGARYFAMPVYAYVLWGLGLLALAIRLAVRRGQPKPDGSRLPARAVGLLALAALTVVWHLAFVDALGFGVTSPGLDAATLGAVAAVELGTLAVVIAMVAVPSRLLLGNALRILGRPKWAWYAPAAGRLVAAAIGVPLLLGFVDFTLGLFG